MIVICLLVNNIILNNIIGRYIKNMSKTYFFCFFHLLKLSRVTTIRGTRWILGVAEQRLSTPVVFTAAFLKSLLSCLVFLLSACVCWCATRWSVVCHRNLLSRKRAIVRHTTLSFSNFLHVSRLDSKKSRPKKFPSCLPSWPY